jgi:hypothetical protein
MLVCKLGNDVTKVKVKQKKVLIPLPLLGNVLDLTINNSQLLVRGFRVLSIEEMVEKSTADHKLVIHLHQGLNNGRLE